MDVALAKDPFRFNTLSEQVLHIATQLDCVNDILNIKWSDVDSGESGKIL
jgi:hypothetical protein